MIEHNLKSIFAKTPSWYVQDRKNYKSLYKEIYNKELKYIDSPQVNDRTATTEFDTHYTYQGPWVMRNLLKQKPAKHIDVGSWVVYLGFFSSLQPTTFVDIRPAKLSIPGVSPKKGSVLDLDFKDRSVQSLSCLHAIEHIGLGRYGDPLDPLGTEKAARELSRVISSKGDLYVSLPVGREVTYFNAHRVTDPEKVQDLFCELDLTSFSVILDGGIYKENVSPKVACKQDYACGMYHFTRRP